VHDRVAGRPSEPGVRRQVLLADVRLELDDPARASWVACADEARAEQGGRCLERGPPDERRCFVQRLKM
jgi:hypothetical protein